MASAQRTVWKRAVVPSCASTQNMFQETNLGNTNGGPNSVLASFCRETTCSNYERILFFIVFSAQFWVYDLVTLQRGIRYIAFCRGVHSLNDPFCRGVPWVHYTMASPDPTPLFLRRIFFLCERLIKEYTDFLDHQWGQEVWLGFPGDRMHFSDHVWGLARLVRGCP